MNFKKEIYIVIYYFGVNLDFDLIFVIFVIK